jgi:hypothetical protein
MWTLEKAVPLKQKIAPIAKRYGFSVALYGSVLDKGQSRSDLDLFFVQQDACDVLGCLQEIAMLPEIRNTGTAFRCTGGACAVIWLRDGNHIDAQFSSHGLGYEECEPT